MIVDGHHAAPARQRHGCRRSLFKPAKKAAAPAVEKRALPETKELVSLETRQRRPALFPGRRPGWQDRINDALRAVMLANPKD